MIRSLLFFAVGMFTAGQMADAATWADKGVWAFWGLSTTVVMHLGWPEEWQRVR